MPESSYHKKIKKIIISLAKESGKFRIHKEEKIPLPHPNFEGFVFHYKPEIHLETKHGKVYVFEILYDEINDLNLVIADIIQSYIIPHISKVFFITKSKEDSKKVDIRSSVIGARLEKMSERKIKWPEVSIYEITEEEVLNPVNLREKLKEKAIEDGWY